MKLVRASERINPGDTFVVDGTKLDEQSPNDATISALDGDGKIPTVTVTGTVNILLDSIYDGQVYKLNFSTASRI